MLQEKSAMQLAAKENKVKHIFYGVFQRNFQRRDFLNTYSFDRSSVSKPRRCKGARKHDSFFQTATGTIFRPPALFTVGLTFKKHIKADIIAESSSLVRYKQRAYRVNRGD
ncbi:hypothetical protein CEXT_56751 [Caerostris extrusa]|uniref:Uncharacterized protein n=1 Tax=Caerostris extrusa TaxID=172846 RepID=A0AAV4TU45_CAEEX|nr:hypothetical protein CEXT_56751 [Caerostris extrusa]